MFWPFIRPSSGGHFLSCSLLHLYAESHVISTWRWTYKRPKHVVVYVKRGAIKLLHVKTVITLEKEESSVDITRHLSGLNVHLQRKPTLRRCMSAHKNSWNKTSTSENSNEEGSLVRLKLSNPKSEWITSIVQRLCIKYWVVKKWIWCWVSTFTALWSKSFHVHWTI
jgi:hypothetical protein